MAIVDLCRQRRCGEVDRFTEKPEPQSAAARQAGLIDGQDAADARRSANLDEERGDRGRTTASFRSGNQDRPAGTGQRGECGHTLRRRPTFREPRCKVPPRHGFGLAQRPGA
ncbi:hypothetical protein GCM10022380_05160 [Amycolatopsis tucumanensis]|uniref:Uncharacterized protein n=1 Tax=Amycolatopsis tucumanensis TaxID=401106 RepID=A0ABP7HGA9_9PSEU